LQWLRVEKLAAWVAIVKLVVVILLVYHVKHSLLVAAVQLFAMLSSASAAVPQSSPSFQYTTSTSYNTCTSYALALFQISLERV
jgi:hypothetical protein